MEVKLENLIERIKKDGVESAQKEAEQILRKAEEDKDALLLIAESDTKKLKEKARKDISQLQANAELAIKQSSRICLQQMRKKILELFDSVFKETISAALTPEFLKELILKIVDQWSKDQQAEIVVSDKDKKEIEKELFSGIKNKLKDDIFIKPSPDISSGFRIGLKGEDVYYDFTDETLVEMLKQFLNPRLKEILDRKDG